MYVSSHICVQGKHNRPADRSTLKRPTSAHLMVGTTLVVNPAAPVETIMFLQACSQHRCFYLCCCLNEAEFCHVSMPHTSMHMHHDLHTTNAEAHISLCSCSHISHIHRHTHTHTLLNKT